MKTIQLIEQEELALPFQFPWNVFIEILDTFCGGSLISEKWVISAAHCFIVRPPDVTCYIGSNKKFAGEPIKSKVIINHHRFNPATNGTEHYEYDISLLLLTKKVNFSRRILPLELPKSWMNDEYLLKKACVLPVVKMNIGNLTNFNMLRVIHKQIAPLDFCKPASKDKICGKHMEYNHNKVKIPKNGTISCAGEYGTTLSYFYRGKYYAVGIHSYTRRKDCLDILNGKFIFESVHQNVEWIRLITRIESGRRRRRRPRSQRRRRRRE